MKEMGSEKPSLVNMVTALDRMISVSISGDRNVRKLLYLTLEPVSQMGRFFLYFLSISCLSFSSYSASNLSVKDFKTLELSVLHIEGIGTNNLDSIDNWSFKAFPNVSLSIKSST